jgi:hypothetical protein
MDYRRQERRSTSPRSKRHGGVTRSRPVGSGPDLCGVGEHWLAFRDVAAVQHRVEQHNPASANFVHVVTQSRWRREFIQP